MDIMKFAMLFFLATLPALAQTNIDASTPPPVQSHANRNASSAPQVEQIRTACINGRRAICGKVLKVLPDGLVVESGYTNLLRPPLDRSWLVPGTVTARRDPNLVESHEPGSICAGLLVLTELPKSRRTKVKNYDYVIIEGYPAGHYTYTSVGNLRKTVRRFSARLETAVKLNLLADEDKEPAHAGDVK
jgi:hypothetical protein